MNTTRHPDVGMVVAERDAARAELEVLRGERERERAGAQELIEEMARRLAVAEAQVSPPRGEKGGTDELPDH